MNRVQLDGCRPTSLLAYLKGLGVFRVLAEQLDPSIRASWRDEVLVLDLPGRTALSSSWFVETYRPSPFVVSWSGSDFFKVRLPPRKSASWNKPPDGGELIEAFLAAGGTRLKAFRRAICDTLEVIRSMGLKRGAIQESGATKGRFMLTLRNRLPEEVLPFLDVAYLVKGAGDDGWVVNSLLGGGGGNDGNLHLGANFMQCLWLCLPEFAPQRKFSRRSPYGIDSRAAVDVALFGGATQAPVGIPGNSPGLYHPGGVGGPNAHEGFEAPAVRNPWDFILAVEGLPLFAGAVSRRAGAGTAARAAFPFLVDVTPAGAASLVAAEARNREIWLPLWEHPATYREVQAIFGEGRADNGTRSARTGLDLARAAINLGVDRGLSGFKRCALLRGRVGGKNYHTAAVLGTIEVVTGPSKWARLLQELEPWLDCLRRTRSNERTATRYGRHLRGIEDAIFRYIQRPRTRALQDVLRQLGRAEQALATAGKARPVPPLRALSPLWLEACNDDSPEYRLATALASIYDPQVGPIRVQLEPISWDPGARRLGSAFGENRQAVAWRRGHIAGNLAAVLSRRILEGRRLDCAHVPIDGRLSVSLGDVECFLKGNLDEEKLSDLLWGLATLRWDHYRRADHNPRFSRPQSRELSAAYGILKLAHLPRDLVKRRRQDGRLRWKFARRGEQGLRILPDLKIVRWLRAGRAQAALEAAFHRLHVSGLRPLGHRPRRGAAVPRFFLASREAIRLAAALLIPVHDVDRLVRTTVDVKDEDTTASYGMP